MSENPAYERIRRFMVYRPYLASDDGIMSSHDYSLLKDRSLILQKKRLDYLLAFIDGWESAKAGHLVRSKDSHV